MPLRVMRIFTAEYSLLLTYAMTSALMSRFSAVIPFEGDLGEHLQLIAAVYGEFEFLRRRISIHLFFQQRLHVAFVAVEKAHRRLHAFPVLLFGNEMRARRGAAVYMIVQARLFRLLADGRITGTHSVRHVHDLENVAHAHAAHVRPEISAPLFQLARDRERGKFFRNGYLDIGVGFIVL